jgi:glycosyltransferase involved in cell wall biosynthesis
MPDAGSTVPRGAHAPDLTVVIPTRDRWRLLSRTLAGALAQEDVQLEVVVVDDGSQDGTSDRIAELGDERVRCISHETPLGVARARNRGVAEGRGRWIAFLDDDDLWSPRKLVEQIAAADSVDAGFVYSSAAVVDHDGKLLLVALAPDPGTVGRALLIDNLLPAGGSNVLARTDLVRRLGGFDERLSALDDWDLWIRLALGARAARCLQLHVAYVEHGRTKHRTDLEERMRDLAVLADKHRAASAAEGVEFGAGLLERWIAAEQALQGDRLAAARTLARAALRYRRPGLATRAASALLGPRMTRLARRSRVRLRTAPGWLSNVNAM